VIRLQLTKRPDFPTSSTATSIGSGTRRSCVGLHRHPIALHYSLVDGIRLRNADDLAVIVTEFPQVVAVRRR